MTDEEARRLLETLTPGGRDAIRFIMRHATETEKIMAIATINAAIEEALSRIVDSRIDRAG